MDLDQAAAAAVGIDAASDAIKRRAQGIGDLPQMVQSHRLLVIDPFQRHAAGIGPEHMLAQVVHGTPLPVGPLLAEACPYMSERHRKCNVLVMTEPDRWTHRLQR